MQGRLVQPIIRCLALGAALLMAGCSDALPSPAASAGRPTDAAGPFDPSTAGTIQGHVRWQGELLSVKPFRAPVSPLSEQSGGKPTTWRNPHAPVVDPSSRGVAGAVVFLRGIDPARARAWDHAPVVVELRDFQVRVLQGSEPRSAGFVRRGEPVEFRSVQPVLDTLVARGDAFFALTFPVGGRPCRRTLPRSGVVEISSGTGHFWMRGHLFVDDHPYYTRTDAEGNFRLRDVPPGAYEMVCWHPNWHEAEHELDADTGLMVRLQFRPAVEIKQPVRLGAAGTVEVGFTLGAGLFAR